ncbi:19726_t:CDS:2, partial [Racocetra persica]
VPGCNLFEWYLDVDENENSEANDPEHYHRNRVDAEKDNFVKATVNNDDETVFDHGKLIRSSNGIFDVCRDETNVEKDKSNAYNSHQNELNVGTDALLDVVTKMDTIIKDLGQKEQ